MTDTIIPDRLALVLNGYQLDDGSHSPGDLTKGAEACVMEAVAWVTGEPWSDRPQCVSPILTSFAISLNDQWGKEQRQKLKPLIPGMVGTRDDGLDKARGYLALDWLIRTYTPAWLDLAGLTAEAQALRDLRRIVDMVAAQEARPVVLAGRHLM